MNILRFFKKCFFDRPAAMRSVQLVIRSFSSRLYWFFKPGKPLIYRFPRGGYLLLEPGHFSTICIWPAVDNYEPDVQACLKYILRPGKVFLDCGANIGFFSVLAAGLVGREGRVVAVEANPEEFRFLERNLEINRLEPGICCALASNPGEVDLLIPPKKGVYSSLRLTKYLNGNLFSSLKVVSRRLDDVIKERALSRVDLVKIDVEGGELDVLYSAPYLLERFRPLIIIEYGINTWPYFGSTPEGLKELTRRFCYAIRLFDTKKQKLIMISDEMWETSCINLVLVPEELLKEL